MPIFVRLAPCLLVFAFAPAHAAVCESARLDLPEPVADAVRPYVVCGMFTHDQVDTAVSLNGVAVAINGSLAGQPPAVCADIRAKAALEADRDLEAAMPDRPAREAYIEAVLQDADRFIAASQASDAIGIDPPEKLASCGMAETGAPNALAEDEG